MHNTTERVAYMETSKAIAALSFLFKELQHVRRLETRSLRRAARGTQEWSREATSRPQPEHLPPHNQQPNGDRSHDDDNDRDKQQTVMVVIMLGR